MAVSYRLAIASQRLELFQHYRVEIGLQIHEIGALTIYNSHNNVLFGFLVEILSIDVFRCPAQVTALPLRFPRDISRVCCMFYASEVLLVLIDQDSCFCFTGVFACLHGKVDLCLNQ